MKRHPDHGTTIGWVCTKTTDVLKLTDSRSLLPSSQAYNPITHQTLTMSQTPSPRSSSDEQRPLLDSDATSDSPTQAGWLHRQLPAAFDSLRQTVWPFAILAFLLELSNVLLDVSATSLREQAICDEYYRRRGGLIGIWSSPSHCKIPPIQIEFQFVQSWQVVYDGLAGVSCHAPLSFPNVDQKSK